MQKLIFFSSTDLLSCSVEASDYFYNERTATIVYNGIDISKYTKKISEEKSNIYKIVSVGRCATEKNPLFALEVIAQLRKLRDDFEYIWVGGGELLEFCRQKATELGISDFVEFLGMRDDVPQIMSSCGCFLMPSFFEGLPISLIEAQISGLKCIVSKNISNLSDIGRVTYISLETGAEKWAEIIDKKLDEPVPLLDEEKAKLFDIKHTVQQLESIYDK